jgi:hypothetical protein
MSMDRYIDKESSPARFSAFPPDGSSAMEWHLPGFVGDVARILFKLPPPRSLYSGLIQKKKKKDERFSLGHMVRMVLIRH